MNASNTAVAQTSSPVVTRARVPIGSAPYNEVVEFLYDEAALLDNQRFDEWAQLLAEDLSYTAPLRLTRTGAERGNTVVRTTKHFDDDYLSIMGRLGRLKTKSAWAEDPPTRSCYMVSNIEVEPIERTDEYTVHSVILNVRGRNETEEDWLLARRKDRLRRIGEGHFRLSKREIYITQAVMLAKNLNIFL